jgi:hypothetical protein
VVDHFHVIRVGNAAVDEVGRRVQQETAGHRGRSGRKGDPLYYADLRIVPILSWRRSLAAV